MELRQQRLLQLHAVLAGRRIAWYGIRGLDAAPYWRCGLLRSSASEIAPLDQLTRGALPDDCLEKRLQRRVDHNRYQVDLDQSPQARAFRADLLARRTLGKTETGCVLVAYRPAEFLAAVDFTRDDVTAAYLVAVCQRMFEHKPWVERQFEQLGLKTLGWRYVRDQEEARLHHALKELGPLVVRSTYTSGGVGVRPVRSVAELRSNIPLHTDGFVGFSPLLEGALPLNLNACVYRNGAVRAFHVSVQLIGLSACTAMPYGFCGNDFAAAALLEPGILGKVQQIAAIVGRWAAAHGYCGQFGLDLLLHRGELFIAEMNARFQASTVLSDEIATAQGTTGPYLEHVAAFLGMEPPPESQMPDVAQQTARSRQLVGSCALSQIICYNDRGTVVHVTDVDPTPVPANCTPLGWPARGVLVAPDAMLGKVFASDQVTDDGYTLRGPYGKVRSVFKTSQVL